VRTARAKGLPERVVIFKHALRNALNPVITAISGWVASLLAGAFFIEYIFAWKGLGSEMIHAILTLDLPVIMGVTLFVGVVLVTVNIFVDLLYAWVDPRIRISGK
jgi:peptide/nickel transport system permease protein